jgi:single-stranded-DNA-specific exonuclease
LGLERSRTIPRQRWQIHPAQSSLAGQIASQTQLSPLLAQVLINRGFTTPELVEGFINPEKLDLRSPLEEFADLGIAVELLVQAIADQKKIAICGDYDADGMTSTALLLRSLRGLNAQVDYAIPSRMQEGYGINERIVEEFAAEGVALILTVDNGIAAQQPIARARELGLAVIITDHHDLPPELPCANAILNPKLLQPTSVYASLAGVGVAYILAVSLAQRLGKTQALITPLLELYTLGTIADLAALTGVNRRWLKRGLKLLPRSQFAGVQALIQVSGGLDSAQAAKPDAIGFRLGPRINAVGRIGDPQTVIELLTTDDPGIALERAMQCEQTNRERQQLCSQIEQAAIAWVEQSDIDLLQTRVLVIVQPDWHHGVIGIVASRLVERYGVPVFIGTYEDGDRVRGSARGIPEFDVFAALQFCADLLDKFGGHRAAGGFSFAADQLENLRSRLSQFACQQLEPDHLKPLVTVDAEASLQQIDSDLYHQIDQLQPWGIGNPEPVFYSMQVRVSEQKPIGKDGLHLKLTLAQFDPAQPSQPQISFKAMAWRWGEYYPLPETLDVAYRLRENTWNDQTNLELELVGVRLPEVEPQVSQPTTAKPANSAIRISTPTAIAWSCPEPPAIANMPSLEWLPLISEPSTLVPELEGHILIYGDQRPYLSTNSTAASLEYDRPSRPCNIFLLWTLPPSWTHLRWLLSRGQPQQIYVRNALPKLPTALELRQRLQIYLSKNPQQPLNLLELGQKSWVAPCTLVSALRDLGYTCENFPPTQELNVELQRLERWYLYPPEQLAKLG